VLIRYARTKQSTPFRRLSRALGIHMNHASLVYRGENFKAKIDNVYYQGACVWSWSDDLNSMGIKSRQYPVYLIAESINRKGIMSFFKLSKDDQIKIARNIAVLLNESDKGESQYLVKYAEVLQ